jgi:DNA-binding response OmpR family regulator
MLSAVPLAASHACAGDTASLRLLLVHGQVDEGSQLMKVLSATGVHVTWTRMLRESLTFAQPDSGFNCLLLDTTAYAASQAGIVQKFASAHRGLPMLVLTDEPTLEGRMALLDAGADDCLSKPVHMLELLTRLRALFRRSTGHAQPNKVQGTLALDSLECTVMVEGRAVKLTKKEFALLAALQGARGRVVPRDQLLSKVWGHLDCPSDAVVEYFVHMLRKKVGRETIRTVAGVGYAIALPLTTHGGP